ncbi:unnamed protein product, partial [Choristocarpus tenellus]
IYLIQYNFVSHSLPTIVFVVIQYHQITEKLFKTIKRQPKRLGVKKEHATEKCWKIPQEQSRSTRRGDSLTAVDKYNTIEIKSTNSATEHYIHHTKLSIL